MKYRKKGSIIDARQWTPGEAPRHAFYEWCDVVGFHDFTESAGMTLTVEIPGGGRMIAHAGDWIVRTAGGNFYPMTDEAFTAAFEPLDGETT